MPQTERTVEADNNAISGIFGEFDSNIAKIEKEMSVKIVNRNEGIKIVGEEAEVAKAERIVKTMVSLIEKGESISDQNLNYMINSTNKELDEVGNIYDDCICLTINGRPVKPKTLGQKKYIDMIRNNTIVFGIGPAGTGKTYLAMAMAITAFKNNEVNRIIMTRPAIEAGEKLGFLPGDLLQKGDPYLRPLYDGLYDVLGADTAQKYLEREIIEIAPLAYMRGRTLDNAFIILDEAQNTTNEQMKMFLTRIGFGSKAVITGDITQIDLPKNTTSGLLEAERVLSGIEEIGFNHLSALDVVRHPVVAKIIKAYEHCNL